MSRNRAHTHTHIFLKNENRQLETRACVSNKCAEKRNHYHSDCGCFASKPQRTSHSRHSAPGGHCFAARGVAVRKPPALFTYTPIFRVHNSTHLRTTACLAPRNYATPANSKLTICRARDNILAAWQCVDRVRRRRININIRVVATIMRLSACDPVL